MRRLGFAVVVRFAVVVVVTAVDVGGAVVESDARVVVSFVAAGIYDNGIARFFLTLQ